MRTLAALLLLALLAHAQGISRTGIDMMPGIERDQRREMYRAFYGPRGRINKLVPQLGTVVKQLGKQPKNAALRRKHAQLKKQIAAQHRAIDENMRGAGLSVDQLARLKRMPQGELREERYNHGVVLEAPGLTDDQLDVLDPLVAAIDGAQRALGAQRKHLAPSLKDTEKTLRQQFNASFRTQHRNMEKRFWRVVYYTLQPEQMVAVRKLLSPRYAYTSDPQRQIYLLPGITASQASRVRAAFVEHQSEVTADQAAVRTLRVKIKDKKLSKPERQALQKQSGAAYERMQDLGLDLRNALREILNDIQLAQLRSVTPQLNPFERYQHPRKILGEMGLRPQQQQALAKLHREYETSRRATQNKLNADTASMMQGGFGPESPQMMTMETMKRGAMAENIIRLRRMGHTAVTDILAPEQIVHWVIAPKS